MKNNPEDPQGMRGQSERDSKRHVTSVCSCSGHRYPEETDQGPQMLHKPVLLGWSSIHKSRHAKVKANGAVSIVNVAPLTQVFKVFLKSTK